MDSWTQWTTIALIVATAVGAVGVLGQLVNQRRQRRLAEAEAHVQQASAWAALAEDWQRCVVVAASRRASFLHWVPEAMVSEFLEAVERYRKARIAWNEVLSGHQIDDAVWDNVSREESQAREAIAPYVRSVQRIVTHLAQVSSLILRKQLSIEAVYGALGPECLRVGDDLINILKMGYSHNGGCVAPDNAERRLWEQLTAERVVGRLGWGNFLDVARGTAERVGLLLDLMKQHGLRIGDLTEGPSPEFDPIGPELSDVDRLALAWRAARPFGRIRAAGIVLTMAAAGRTARRASWYSWEHPSWARSLWTKLGGGGREVPDAGPIKWLLDTGSLPLDLMGAVRRAKSVRDIRRLERPDNVEDRLKQDAFTG